MSSRIRGPRGRTTERLEEETRATDLALLTRAEAVRGNRREKLYGWEEDVLEHASRRVYHEERSLMPGQRKALQEILARRVDGIGRVRDFPEEES